MIDPTEIGNIVYATVAPLLEGIESRTVTIGNGHHAAQAVGRDVEAKVRERMALDRTAPTPTTAPGLDLDAVERAERAMTPVPWEYAHDIAWICGQDPDGEVYTVANLVQTSTVDLKCYNARQNGTGIIALRNAAPALIAEVRALRHELATVRKKSSDARELLGSLEHESSCAIGPYGPKQNSADCCLVGVIAAALEAL